MPAAIAARTTLIATSRPRRGSRAIVLPLAPGPDRSQDLVGAELRSSREAHLATSREVKGPACPERSRRAPTNARISYAPRRAPPARAMVLFLQRRRPVEHDGDGHHRGVAGWRVD